MKKLYLIPILILLLQFTFVSAKKVNIKNSGLVLFMNSENGESKITDLNGKFSKEISKIIFNGKDITEYIKNEFDLTKLTFSTDKMLIFDGDKIVNTNNKWSCKKGRVFIPGSNQYLIIKVSNIVYDDSSGVLTGKDGLLRKIIPEKELKETIEKIGNISINLNEMK